MKKIIILLGVPGSGKGTQAKRIASTYNYAHISTGDLFRGLLGRTDLDEELSAALEAMKVGALIPAHVIARLAFEAIEKGMSEQGGVVLDGAIRSEEQAALYQNFFEQKGWSNEVVVLHIDITDEESIRRLETRLAYAQKGEVVPALQASAQGGEVEKARNDDNPEVARKRLVEQGNDAIAPLVTYYGGMDVLRRIDGNQSIDQVEKSIETILAA